jgi:HEPN domain-containing protein
MISVEALYQAGQHLHATFFLQQAVEKTMKAVIVGRMRAAPPCVHNLRALADLIGLKLDRDQLHLVEILNGYFTESRYPGEWERDLPTVTGRQAQAYIERAKELIAWLKQQP